MAMIHPAEILRRPPGECLVIDATGRRLANVFTCNPETGEVISYDMPWITRAWIRLLWTRVDRRHPLRPLIQPGWTCLLTRHGFWPAPLRLVERRIEMPEHWNCRCTSIPVLVDPAELTP
jgi:hypothetical protein